jgi:hypothetical protein
MEGLRVALYQSLGDLTGRRCTFEELVGQVSRFSRDSLLWVCCHTSVALRLFDPDSHPEAEYSWLIRYYFAPRLAAHLEVGYWTNPQRIVFHRRQLLFISKLALMHCKPTGLDASLPKNGFALTCLMANDHLEHGALPKAIASIASREDFAALVTELLAMQEFAGHLRPETVTRAFSMFVSCPKLLISHPDYIDIDKALNEAGGYTYAKIFAVTVGYISRYLAIKPEELRKNPRIIATIPDHLSKLKIPVAELARYFEFVSGDPLALRAELVQHPTAPSDLTIFRKYPLVERWFDVATIHQRLGHVPLDIELWWQKVYTAPFWFLVNKFKTKFQRFWGAVFEEYAHSIIEPDHNSAERRFIRNPSSPHNAHEELCDAALVDGDALVLIEYKSVLLRADVKYSGVVARLVSHIESKFVRDPVTKRPKAVVQLATAAKALFPSERPAVPWVDIHKIRRCYLLIVTLDEIGEAFAISPLLETFMGEHLERSNLPDILIRPVFCTNIGTLERIQTSLKQGLLLPILDRWYEINPSLATPLLAIGMNDLIVERGDSEWKEWMQTMDVAKEELFDEETIVAAEAR